VKGLHLAALWAFAFVQPMFDLLGGQAQFFVARGSTGADIVVFALAFTLVPPAVMTLAVWLLGRVRPALGEGLQVVLVGVLVAAFVLPPAGDLLAGSALSVLLAAVVGAGTAALYARAAAVRSFMTVLSPAPLLFLLLFLVVSPVSELVLPDVASEAVAGTASSDTPVVMIVFDELAATSLMDAREQIDARRFPAFASLAADATWYRKATTVAGRTTEAVPALLTGRRPREGDLPTAAHHPQSLFTLLSRSHYLHVVEPITDVCPHDLCSEARPGMGRRLRALATDLRVVSEHLLLPDDLRDGLPPIDSEWQGFAEGGVPEATEADRAALRNQVGVRLKADDPRVDFAQILRAIGSRSSRPPFLFLHTSLPHAPWWYLHDGRRYTEDPALPGLVQGEWVGPQWLVDQAFQRHLVQTQYADHLLGTVLERLRSTGLYERALVVVGADHGVSFRAGDRRRVPTQTNLQDVAGMPLFIKRPGQDDGRINDNAVRTIDVLPTIAAELGIRLPRRVDGVPAGERDANPETPIEVPDSFGLGTTGTFGAILEQRVARLRYQRSLLEPAGDDPYAIGPRPQLIGRSPGAPTPGRGRVRLEDPAAFGDVRPSAAVLPAFVTGTVTGLPEGTALAVTVNGRIEATTRVDGSGKGLRFGALVAPRALRAGANRIGVLEIASGGRLTAVVVD
jgi:hypothetical protein